MSLSCNPKVLRRWRLVGGLACTIAANTSAADVWVITDQHHPIYDAPAGTRVIELDVPASLEAQLSARLPAGPMQAAAVVRQRLTAGGIVLQRRLAAAYQGVTDAWNLGVTEIPAVVVDRHFVVYGDPDVKRAVALIEQYPRTRS